MISTITESRRLHISTIAFARYYFSVFIRSTIAFDMLLLIACYARRQRQREVTGCDVPRLMPDEPREAS